MANTVYKVDNQTRLILPDSQWAFSVRERLSQMGHTVVATDEDEWACTKDRSAEENARVDQLLDSTGL